MSDLVRTILEWLEELPVAGFALVGAFIEGLISPIPSPVIMATLGGLAADNEAGVLLSGSLILLAALGKLVAAILLFWLAWYFQDGVLGFTSRWMGVGKEDVEELKEYFDSSYSDELVIIGLRAVPLFPTGATSILAGLMGIGWVSYIWSSFVGFVVRIIPFYLIGYFGLDWLKQYESQLSLLSYVGWGVLILMIVGMVWWLKKRSRTKEQ